MQTCLSSEMNLYKLSRILGYLYVALASEERRKTRFNWPPYDKRFDCIVGLSYDHGYPLGIGTLITRNTIVTSANSLGHYNTSTFENSGTYLVLGNSPIIVHAISKHWNTSEVLPVNKTIIDLSHRHKEWIKMGLGRLLTHSPIHDLVFMKLTKHVKKPPVDGREPFYLDEDFRSYFTDGFTTASFEIVRNRKSNNVEFLSQVEIHTYEDSDEVDCDEWIPRAWGRFVCLQTLDDVEIQSGAPLFQYGQLRGVGCFALKKGKENILVFTDYPLYREAFDKVIDDTSNKTIPHTTRKT